MIIAIVLLVLEFLAEMGATAFLYWREFVKV
jgi:hypothetical protein